MANGAIADRNRVATGTVSETGWSLTSPAENALYLPLNIKARSVAGGEVVLEGEFDERYPVTYCALWATNLRQADRFRLELFANTAKTIALFNTRDPVTGLDRRVIPSLSEWRQLRWGDPNLFRGDLPPEDYALYPSNVHVSVPLCRPIAWRWTMWSQGWKPDPTNPRKTADAGYVEVGHVWASDSLSFTTNYQYGAVDGWNPTDEVKRTPGGGAYVEPGTGYRSAEIPLEFLMGADGDRLYDLSKRVSWDLPVAWLPNLDDPSTMFRYGFIGQRRDALKKTKKFHRIDGATVSIEEITT